MSDDNKNKPTRKSSRKPATAESVVIPFRGKGKRDGGDGFEPKAEVPCERCKAPIPEDQLAVLTAPRERDQYANHEGILCGKCADEANAAAEVDAAKTLARLAGMDDFDFSDWGQGDTGASDPKWTGNCADCGIEIATSTRWQVSRIYEDGITRQSDLCGRCANGVKAGADAASGGGLVDDMIAGRKGEPISLADCMGVDTIRCADCKAEMPYEAASLVFLDPKEGEEHECSDTKYVCAFCVPRYRPDQVMPIVDPSADQFEVYEFKDMPRPLGDFDEFAETGDDNYDFDFGDDEDPFADNDPPIVRARPVGKLSIEPHNGGRYCVTWEDGTKRYLLPATIGFMFFREGTRVIEPGETPNSYEVHDNDQGWGYTKYDFDLAEQYATRNMILVSRATTPGEYVVRIGGKTHFLNNFLLGMLFLRRAARTVRKAFVGKRPFLKGLAAGVLAAFLFGGVGCSGTVQPSSEKVAVEVPAKAAE